MVWGQVLIVAAVALLVTWLWYVGRGETFRIDRQDLKRWMVGLGLVLAMPVLLFGGLFVGKWAIWYGMVGAIAITRASDPPPNWKLQTRMQYKLYEARDLMGDELQSDELDHFKALIDQSLQFVGDRSDYTYCVNSGCAPEVFERASTVMAEWRRRAAPRIASAAAPAK